MSKLTWLITGASEGGLGEHIAQAALARGDVVIATARNIDKLASLEKAGARTMQLDVSESQNVLDHKAEQALDIAGGSIDVLVNNAGVTFMSTTEEMSQENLLREFQINAFAPIALTRAFLPSFRAANKPATVVFISSAAGINGLSGSGSYSGSKHALEGLVDALHQETYPTFKLRSVVIESGFLRSKFIANAGPISTKIPAYQPMVDFWRPLMEQMNGKQPGDPRKHAEVIVDLVRDEGTAKGKVVDPFGDWPLRLPIGPDAFGAAKKRADGYLKVLESWEDVIKGTNVVE